MREPTTCRRERFVHYPKVVTLIGRVTSVGSVVEAVGVVTRESAGDFNIYVGGLLHGNRLRDADAGANCQDKHRPSLVRFPRLNELETSLIEEGTANVSYSP